MTGDEDDVEVYDPRTAAEPQAPRVRLTEAAPLVDEQVPGPVRVAVPWRLLALGLALVVVGGVGFSRASASSPVPTLMPGSAVTFPMTAPATAAGVAAPHPPVTATTTVTASGTATDLVTATVTRRVVRTVTVPGEVTRLVEVRREMVTAPPVTVRATITRTVRASRSRTCTPTGTLAHPVIGGIDVMARVLAETCGQTTWIHRADVASSTRSRILSAQLYRSLDGSHGVLAAQIPVTHRAAASHGIGIHLTLPAQAGWDGWVRLRVAAGGPVRTVILRV